MAELEKVIKGLECCQLAYECKPYERCPYSNGYACGDCDINQLHYDAIALLKQEAVKPEPIMGTSISDCGKCKHAVAPGMNYCPVCGCRIDWN